MKNKVENNKKKEFEIAYSRSLMQGNAAVNGVGKFLKFLALYFLVH